MQSQVYEKSQLWEWADRDFCGSNMLPDCYFLPISNCTPPTGITVTQSRYNPGNPVQETPQVVHFFQHEGWYNKKFVPPVRRAAIPSFNKYIDMAFLTREIESQLEQIFAEMDKDGEEPVTWWRAVTTKFIYRPNYRYQGLFGSVDAFPPRAFAIHVRHGDKSSEMTLHPFAEYMNLTEQIKKENPYMAMSDTIVLFTDDVEVLGEAAQWNRRNSGGTQWQFIHFNEYSASDMLSSGRWYIATAFIAARADAWIFTLKSNWCRVINEMRKMNGKKGYIFLDMEPGEWKRSIAAAA